MSLEAIVDQFLIEINGLDLMKDPKIRNPPSKHQRMIRQVSDLVKGFEHLVNNLKHEGKTE